jgi:hypothetical protein
MSHSNDRVSYRQLLSFFLPLGATPFIISSSHSILNAALARLPLPTLSLAVFGVVKSLTSTISAPGFSTRDAVVSLTDDGGSFRKVMKFVWSLGGLLLITLLTLAFTPAGSWVLRNVMGISNPQHIRLAYAALQITCFLPLVITLRNGAQGLAIGLETTKIMPVGTLLRFTAVCLFLWWAVHTQAVSGIVVGGLSWTMGIGLEGLLIAAYFVKRFGSLSQAAEHLPHRNTHELAVGEITRFSAPLGIMAVLASSLQLMLQSGLAHSVSPTHSLAAYSVAWGLIKILVGPVGFLRQCSLVYVEGLDDPNWQTVKRFSLAMGLTVAGLILTLALTPLGHWLLSTVIAVSEPIARSAVATLVAFAPLPVVRAWRQAYWGLLMGQRRTPMITGAKVANLLAVAGTLVLVFGFFQAVFAIPPSAVGALAYTLGEGVESVIIWHYTEHHCPCQTVSAQV